MIKGPTNLASIFPPFLFLRAKSFLRTLLPTWYTFGLACFRSYSSFCFCWATLMFAFASLSRCRRSAAICSTSDGDSSPTSRILFRQSSAASLRISMSIARVAFLPNISSKGVKQVDSCRDVLYAKTHVSKNSSHWLFLFAVNLTSMFWSV